jgi:hypothetical protein
MPYMKTIRRPAAHAVQGVVNDLIISGRSRPHALRIATLAFNRVRSYAPSNLWTGWIRPGGSLAGMGQGIEVLAGKSQSYYDLLDGVQNRVIGLQAEMAQIGQEAWDNALWSNTGEVASAGYEPIDNYLFSPMMSWWGGNYKKLIITPSVEPTEATINEVNRLAAGTDKLIAFVKTLLPREVADAATAYRKEAIDKVDNYKLTSPGDVARKVVMDEIKDKLGGGMTTIIIVAIAAAAAAAGAFAFFGRR